MSRALTTSTLPPRRGRPRPPRSPDLTSRPTMARPLLSRLVSKFLTDDPPGPIDERTDPTVMMLPPGIPQADSASISPAVSFAPEVDSDPDLISEGLAGLIRELVEFLWRGDMERVEAHLARHPV